MNMSGIKSEGRTVMPGEYVIKKPSINRRLTMETFDALPAGHNMTALIEFDVTKAKKLVRTWRLKGMKVSFFAFIIKSIAAALAEKRELNAVRGGNRIVEFRDVDVNIPVEMESKDGKAPRQIVVRNAAEKTVEEICMEIEADKNQHRLSGNAGREDKWALSLMKILTLLPKFIMKFVLINLVGNPLSVKKMSGTTFVTAVGMFGSINGFAVPYIIGPRAVSFALGSIVKKPAAAGREIKVREFLNMTVVFNHDIVDGAPAARFINRLKKIIEKADVL